MNKTALFFSIIISLNLFAYSDLDMDGVDDAADKCPNTLLSELVDLDGCPIENLESPHHFDIIYGLSFAQDSDELNENMDTLTQNIQIDYYYKNFSLQASSSYYNSKSTSYSDNGTNDSYLASFYTLSSSNEIYLRFGVGMILPTYESDIENNNIDYTASINFSYMIRDINMFCGYNYIIVNDDDIEGVVTYQNSGAFSLGIGFYPTDNIYISTSYGSSSSVYVGNESSQIASVNIFYNIDENYFTSFSYSHGLSQSAIDNHSALYIGYYF